MLKNKRKFIIACMLFSILGWTVNKHPFYLSVTELKYNSSEKTMQGAVKVFTNDLEDALKKINGFPVDLLNGKDTIALNKILFEYLQDRLQITVNNKMQSYQLLGFENEQEAIWIYIESQDVESPKRIIIKNTILYDFVKVQSNIAHVYVEGKRKSYKVNCPDAKMEFDFEK